MPLAQTTMAHRMPARGIIVLFGAIGLLLVAWRMALSAPPSAPRNDAAFPAAGPFQPPTRAGESNPRDASKVPGGKDLKNLYDVFKTGGVLMWPILGCSMVMLMFAFERFVSLWRGRILPRPFITRFLLQLEDGQLTPAEALKRCEDDGSPIAQVFAAAVRKWGRSSVEIEQAMLDAGERVGTTLRRNLRVLNTIATITPLLGLLGTVFGMIECFNVVSSTNAMGRPDLLAKGIGEALITTAAGLTVAIPTLIFYLYFGSCADRRIVEIDALGQQVVQLISGESPATTGRPGKQAKKVA